MDLIRNTPPADLLLPGEHILWQGEPFGGLMLQPIDLFLIPFSLLWGGFALFWNISVWRAGAPFFFRLWGLPFLAVGLYAIAGRFLFDAYVRRRLRYWVTDRRIIIRRGGNTRSLDIARLPLVDMQERGDGSGTLRFGATRSFFEAGHGFSIWTPALDPTPQFLRIADVRRVNDLIRRASA